MIQVLTLPPASSAWMRGPDLDAAIAQVWRLHSAGVLTWADACRLDGELRARQVEARERGRHR